MPDDHSDETFNCPFQGDFGYTRATMETIKADVAEIKELVQKQNGRIRKLEIWRAYIIGLAAASAFIVHFILKVLKE